MICLATTQATIVQQNEKDQYSFNKKKDSLSGYLYFLFDLVDEKPILADKADSLFATLWRQPKTNDEKLAYYQLTINLAYHLLSSGQIQISTKWYEQAFRFWQLNSADTLLVKEMDFEEYVCKPLGNNYTRMGDFSKAIFIQQTAINYAKQNNKFKLLPALYANLATTYFSMNSLQEVQTAVNKGISFLQSDVAEDASLLFNIKARTSLEMNLKDSAKYWNNKVLKQVDLRITSPSRYLTALLDKAELLKKDFRFNEVIDVLKEAFQLSQNTTSREKAKVSNEMGMALFFTNQFNNAIPWFKNTLQLFNRDSLGLYPDFTVTSSMFGLALCYDKIGNNDSTGYWYSQAVLNDYYTQQLIDPWLYGENSIYTNDALTEKAIAWFHTQFSLQKKDDYLIKALWLSEISKGRNLLFEQKRAIAWRTDTTKNENKFEELRNDYFSLVQAKDSASKELIKTRIAAKEFQLSLSNNQISKSLTAPSYTAFLEWLYTSKKDNNIIGYYSGNNRLYIIGVYDNKIVHAIDSALPDQTVQSFVNTYFYQGPSAFNNKPEKYYLQSFDLYKKYLPLDVSTNHNYIISPSGFLHQLPFEALCTEPHNPVYFGENNNISYQYSLLQLIKPEKNLPSSSFAVISFDNDYLGFPALPQAKKEYLFLKNISTATSYTADKTSNADFFSALNSNKIIHVATHAVAGNNQDQMFLVLKEKLYLGQLQYNTAQSPLVVLAACETGKGTSANNEGLQSIGRAFINKGVKGILSSRWQVDDVISSKIIQTFYKELMKEKHPARALQNAHKKYLQTISSPAELNPWLWAGFFYQGNNQPIYIKQKTSTLFEVIAILLLVTIASFLLFRKWKKKKRTRLLFLR